MKNFEDIYYSGLKTFSTEPSDESDSELDFAEFDCLIDFQTK